MNDKPNFKSNPLNGVGLENMLTELVSHYGFDILAAYININCFKANPTIASSVKFLKKTTWAREKVELFYLYKFKNLPKVSSEQFETPPRDRIIPEGQVPGEPAVLSLEDAEKERVKREKKAAERVQSKRHHARSGKKFNTNKNNKYSHQQDSEKDQSNASPVGTEDPWAKWRK